MSCKILLFNSKHAVTRFERIAATVAFVCCLVFSITPYESHAAIIVVGSVTPSYNNADPWSLGITTLHVGSLGDGSITVTDSSKINHSGSSLIGYSNDWTGTVTLSGSGTSFINNNDLTTGFYGVGYLNVDSGGKVYSKRGFIGDRPNSTGTVTLNGDGSLWDIDSYLYVGYSGAGTLNIENGAVVHNNDTSIGTHTGSNGTATVTGAGSTWNLGGMRVGLNGSGTLNIESGGAVNSVGGVISDSNGSSGAVTVTGVGSFWNTKRGGHKGGLVVGDARTGTLNIENGGVVENHNGFIGYNTSADGTVTVTGAGSTWNNSGSLDIGHAGVGTLNIGTGGVVNVVQDTWVGKEITGSGSISFNQGTLNTNGLIASTSELKGVGTINTKALASDVDLIFDSTNGLQQTHVLNDLPGQNITINLDVSDPTTRGALAGGYRGTSTLTIADGLNIYSSTGHVGYHGGSIGTATVTGPGSGWDITEGLYVGQSGTGTLSIMNGGMVNNATGSIGENTGSDGTATVTGAGSAWNNNGDLYVGRYGTGALHVTNGGEVDTYYGYVGHWVGSYGDATVAGTGSVWNNTSIMYIGWGGAGKLTVENGGTVNNATGYIATHGGSDGEVTVNGAGSVWNSVDLRIGNSGEGKLIIENGGEVNSRISNVGYYTGSSGTVTVSGVGSIWNNSGYLWVGNNASELDRAAGTLVIESGGVVNNTTASINSPPDSTSTVDVRGAGSIWNNSKSLNINGALSINDGGLVNNTDARIYANGSVVVTGAGSVWNNSGELYIAVGGMATLLISDGGTVIASNGMTFGYYVSDVGNLKVFGGTLDLSGSSMTRRFGVANIDFLGGKIMNTALISVGQPFIQAGGTLAPGGSVGQTDILGDYDLAAGTLEIELGGPGNPLDLVTATGDIDISILGTTLDLRALGNMAAGTYTVLESTGGTITGMFENVNLFNLFGVNVTVLNTGTAITVTLDSDLVFADPNTDGFVGIEDLNIVLGNWNQNVTPGDILAGDLNGDGYVGIEDLNAILGNWNAGTPPPDISVAIPEPGTVGVLVLGVLWGWAKRQRDKMH